ncbi:hypothetical protein [Comamonas thiooxydans]
MLYRRQLSLDVQVPYRLSQAGLHLLVDSMGKEVRNGPSA